MDTRQSTSAEASACELSSVSDSARISAQKTDSRRSSTNVWGPFRELALAFSTCRREEALSLTLQRWLCDDCKIPLMPYLRQAAAQKGRWSVACLPCAGHRMSMAGDARKQGLLTCLRWDWLPLRRLERIPASNRRRSAAWLLRETRKAASSSHCAKAGSSKSRPDLPCAPPLQPTQADVGTEQDQQS